MTEQQYTKAIQDWVLALARTAPVGTAGYSSRDSILAVPRGTEHLHARYTF